MMPDLLEIKSLGLGNTKIRGRTINAVADMLRHQLSIPHIYINPEISGVQSPDVLAVDRAGSGDLHAVRIRTLAAPPTEALLRSTVNELISEMAMLPYHFKYLALSPSVAVYEGPLHFAELPELFDETGIGRIGILAFNSAVLDLSSATDASAISVVVRPERFQIKGESLAAIEKFLDKTTPDIAVRI